MGANRERHFRLNVSESDVVLLRCAVPARRDELAVKDKLVVQAMLGGNPFLRTPAGHCRSQRAPDLGKKHSKGMAHPVSEDFVTARPLLREVGVRVRIERVEVDRHIDTARTCRLCMSLVWFIRTVEYYSPGSRPRRVSPYTADIVGTFVDLEIDLVAQRFLEPDRLSDAGWIPLLATTGCERKRSTLQIPPPTITTEMTR